MFICMKRLEFWEIGLKKCKIDFTTCGISTTSWELKKCYKTLEIPENSDQEQIRTAYLKLVKIYHPDSGTEQASKDKFHEIDTAFKTICNKKSQERWDVPIKDEVKEKDIRHAAPQHRQYLSYGGYGAGNPFQRQKQYTKARASKAAENVLEHRLNKATAEEHAVLDKNKKIYKHDIKTKYGYERLVEDLIQESMSKGEFNNLPGSGKPLRENLNRNPYVDLVTQKLNEVLIDNGFTPKWITLQKEIREDVFVLRNQLVEESRYVSKLPLDEENSLRWRVKVEKYKGMAKTINKKINDYNLLVPILENQLLQISLDKEAQKALIKGDLLEKKNADLFYTTRDDNKTPGSENIYSFLEKIFKSI